MYFSLYLHKNTNHLNMKALLSRILPILITMIITGCNNDIFIDDEHPSITEIEIPDQGNKSITFQTSQLKSIEIAFYNDATFDCTLFDHTGDIYNKYDDRSYIYLYEISSSMPKITRMLAENDDVAFEVTRTGENELTISSIMNMTGYDVHGSIMLSYTYKEEFIAFSILPSPDGPTLYSIKGLSYNKASLSQGFSDEQSTPFRIINETQSVTKQVFNPQQHCTTMVIFNTNGMDRLKLDPDAEMPVVEIPSYIHRDDAEEIAGGFNGREIQFSREIIVTDTPDNALINGGSFNVDFPVEVPPMSAREINLSINRIIMRANGELTLVNNRNDKEIKLPFVVTVMQPYNYSCKWEEATIDE